MHLPFSSSTAFCLLIAGVGGMYWECIRPRWFLPGFAGISLAALGSYSLWLNSDRGIVWIVLPAVCFAVEAFWDTRYLAGVVGTVLITIIGWRLGSAPAVAMALPFGAVSTFLAGVARRAKANKQADLT